MPGRRVTGWLAGCALAALVAGAASADEVVLSTRDGSFSVAGTLVSFDGRNYVVNTVLGQVAIAVDLVVCEGAGCPAEGPSRVEVTVSGDRTLGLRLLPPLLRAYAAGHGAQVRTTTAADGTALGLTMAGEGDEGSLSLGIVPSDSAGGLDSLFKGRAAIALSTRPVRVREARTFEEFGLGALRSKEQETILALDALVLVVHPDNPVRAVSQAAAARAFAGEIADWSDLGGPDAGIRLYTGTGDTAMLELFQAQVLEPQGLQLSNAVTRLDSAEAVRQAVARDPNGFGLTGYASGGAVRAVAIRGECGIHSLPSEFSIKTEEYPLARLHYAYRTNRNLDPQTAAFLEFATSEEAQPLVRAAGYVDQSITLESINGQGMRLAAAIAAQAPGRDLTEMAGTLMAADRLSATFRFETATTRLNARAEADVARLARVLATDRFVNKEVLFVGFTDSIGDAELNRELSRQQAEQVLAAVMTRDSTLGSAVRMRALGFGEVSPLACNESDQGRAINRRVEVWVRDIQGGEQG
jgi:phosphate transport system substrate-binding protein